MSDFLAQHWLLIAAAFLLGLLVKWLLDLFFLRGRLFDTRAQLEARERQLTDARHEQARTSEALKNRQIELEATSRAKLAAEALGARRTRELEAATEEAATLRSALESERTRSSTLSTRASGLEQQLESAGSQVAALRSEILDAALRLAVAQATLQGQDESLAELRAIRESLTQSRDVVVSRYLDAESAHLAQREVNAALQDAVLYRDTTLAGLKSQLAGLESERQSIADLLASRDAEAIRLADSVAHLSPLKQQLTAAETAQSKLRLDLEAAMRVRGEAESALKKRDLELAEWERRAQEYQSAFDDAARENARIAQDLSRSSTQLTAAVAGQKSAESARSGVEDRLAQTLAELSALKAGHESGAPGLARLQEQLAQADANAVAALSTRSALESELAAVSESYARLETQLTEARLSASRADELAEQLGTVEAELAVLRAAPRESAPAAGDLDAVLNDLDQAIRERNGLAAELALLRSRPDGEA
jgi:chromosome segregation ATPase